MTNLFLAEAVRIARRHPEEWPEEIAKLPEPGREIVRRTVALLGNQRTRIKRRKTGGSPCTTSSSG